MVTRCSHVFAWDNGSVEECSPNIATFKYTSFLLATAAGKVGKGEEPSGSVNLVEKHKIPAYTIGAMTPCSRLYAFLGQEIVRSLEHDISDHPYKEWIETYSSENSEASASLMERFLDKLADSLTREELEVLGRLYYHALKLEREFFSAQPLYQKTLVPLLKVSNSANRRYTIVSDFELSCTVKDSSVVLSEIARLTTLKVEQNGAENLDDCKSSMDLRNTWDAISSQYSEENEECLGKILRPEQVDSFYYEGIYKSLEGLSNFEANVKVAESGVLRGLNIDDIKKAGELMVFKDGCVDFLNQILRKLGSSTVDVHILSVCWSGDLIRAAILSKGLNGLHIHSNELSFLNSISTGDIDWRVRTPIDKLRIFKNILSNAKEKENSMEHISIYIGDSLADLLCLLQADIGIVIGTNSTIRTVGKHFGVSFIPLFSGVLKQERAYAESYHCWTKESGILYTVSSWSEVHAFLLGPSN